MPSAWAKNLLYPFTYVLTRTNIPGKGFFRIIAMASLFAPTLMNAIALVYLFGKKGLITSGSSRVTQI